MVFFVTQRSFSNVDCSDIALRDYISLERPLYVPHTAGRYQNKQFRKAKCPVVERLTNSLMMHGRNSGKKQF
ncbi:ribosomal protein S5 [Bonamia ostreae]|uniref:Ribosomal protein S5 n=1 Tax=Bonamia ostreae TaxID=126728 RepID=A0ABV2AQY1_9EUKA